MHRSGGGRHLVERSRHRQALYDALAACGALFGFSNAGVEVPLAFPATPISAAAQVQPRHPPPRTAPQLH
jgi:hypothetical protein